ncbi:MAG: 50S ribosome-binding GTPase, partial [Congregibacter sp.]|nr:50S ribosome-binding GTPase [Congregibacter sp.]
MTDTPASPPHSSLQNASTTAPNTALHNALLIGSPNCGKTLLFNRLTGLQHRVANFPGITVEIARGKLSGHTGVT